MERNEIMEKFGKLVSTYPNNRYELKYFGKNFSYLLNTVNVFSPVGKGQRCLLVAPPKVGKTTLLKAIANSFGDMKDVFMNILLIGERPEEVTDFSESIEAVNTPNLYYSTFNESPNDQIKAVEDCLYDSMEQVLEGKDVVILMDSMTRLVRACNSLANSGKLLSGGIDPEAYSFPKRLFGAAGNYRDAGSLTIIATCLTETNSKMDEAIYEEFKGTGNSEIVLSRRIAEMGIYPAIDIRKSGTRNNHLLQSELEQKAQEGMRKYLGYDRDYSINNQIINRLNRMSVEDFIKSIS